MPSPCEAAKALSVPSRLLPAFLLAAVLPVAAASPATLALYERYALTHAGSAERGRRLFRDPKRARCDACHKVGGEGGELGPDLSAIGGKFDRPHLIESLLEPSRQIVEGYRASALVLAGGRVESGIVKEESAGSITYADAGARRRVLARADILQIEPSPLSLMPEGWTEVFSRAELTDLVAYLETLRPAGKPRFGAGVRGPIRLPEGFEVETVTTGLTGATALEAARDGRIFLGEQTGALRVVKEGKLLEKPFVTLPVDSTWERGLLGVTVHPDFPRVPWVYLCWVAKDPYPHHRISRFTARGDRAVPGSEEVLLWGDDQRTLGGEVPAGHQGGALHFGPDGRLYAAIGEQTAGLPAQHLDTFQGKILRIGAGGEIPADNPFLDRARGKYRAIWALGCRNPFTFAFRGGDGLMLINDVGGTYEEINLGVAGANYGWSVADHGPTKDPRFRSPIHSYPQASISGGDFPPAGGGWPEKYRGRYFFADFVLGVVRTIDPRRPARSELFLSGLRRPVDLRFAPDGWLYVLLRNAWVIDGKFQEGTGSLLRFRPREASLAKLASPGRDPRDSGIAAAIRRAGEADDDVRRLRLLRELRSRAGLDESLRRDLDRMVATIEKWTDSRRLTWFGSQVARTMGFDFGIAEESPLYPLTCLYRARMLVWITLESGNILRHRERRRRFLDRAVENFRSARAAYPANRLIAMYLGKPIANEKRYEAPSGAPAWAVLERENLERLTDIIEWWIEHRMQPDGQFGGGWGDDCEMWRWWAPVLIGFDDSRISAAQARFSRALLEQPHMRGGYTSRMSDVEHTAEDSADAITPMMHLEPESPEWRRRARRLAELMETRWTGRNERGQLQFKSTYFTLERVDERVECACDTVYHPRAVQPALLLWQRTGDPKLGALFLDWLDTWADAAARAERGKPAGIVPSAIHWPDGRPGGVGPDWWDPRNHGEPTLYEWPSALSMLCDSLLLAYHMSGRERYLEPLRSMAAIRLKYLLHPPATRPEPGSEAWCASRLGLLAGTLAKYRALTGRGEFDALLSRDRPGLAFPIGEEERERAEVVARLRRSAQALRVNFPGYTSEVRWTDRVLRFPALFGADMMFREAVAGIETPRPELLYSLVTGDPGGGGYFAMNAVRWRTPPRDIAAMVTDSNTRHFRAELYHFGAKPRRLAADLYLLEPGSYTVTLEALERDGATASSLLERAIEISGRVGHLELELPPRRRVRLRLTRR